MNHPLAQKVALSCYGNAVIAGHKVERFFSSNSTFQFCDSVKFITLDNTDTIELKKRELVYADSPDQWFDTIKAKGALGIRLARLPNVYYGDGSWRMAAFVNAKGELALNVLYPDHGEFWASHWEVWDQNAPNKKIWRVKYALIAQHPAIEVKPEDLNEIISELNDSLKQIKSFSEKHKIKHFTKYFDNALETLRSKGKIKNSYHRDLAPPGILSVEAEMILNACQSAWVFGGMGWWNDMSFEGKDQEAYVKVSEKLYQALDKAIVGAVSSSFYSK